MNLHDLRTLYDYNQWANSRFFGCLQTLTPEQLRSHIQSSFPSLLATMGHIVGAEWVWLSRWQGHSPSSFPLWLEDPTLDDLRSRLLEVESERAEFLEGLSQGGIETPLSYRTLNGAPCTNRLLDLLLHVVNHSSYHRGQLATMLRQVGADPIATDYVLFCREQTT